MLHACQISTLLIEPAPQLGHSRQAPNHMEETPAFGVTTFTQSFIELDHMPTT